MPQAIWRQKDRSVFGWGGAALLGLQEVIACLIDTLSTVFSMWKNTIIFSVRKLKKAVFLDFNLPNIVLSNSISYSCQLLKQILGTNTNHTHKT